MKIFVLGVLVILASLQSYSQVDDALKTMRLYEGSVYVTYGHRITEIFSELTYKMGVGLFPKTNIAYLNYNQLILLMQDTAKNEAWDQQHYLKSRNYIKTQAYGGRIILYVERFDQFLTNNKFFFIIIRDKDEKKLFEYYLPRRPANLVTTDVFSNWAYIDIDVELPDEFYIYVNHKMSDYLSDTKFMLEKNAAPLFRPSEETTNKDQ